MIYAGYLKSAHAGPYLQDVRLQCGLGQFLVAEKLFGTVGQAHGISGWLSLLAPLLEVLELKELGQGVNKA